MVVQEQVNIVMADLNSELAALMNDLGCGLFDRVHVHGSGVWGS